ncbi:MAG: sensor histidine kinase [Gammaproteobacteria bacterium]
MHKILYRPIIVITLVLGAFVAVELAALGGMTWRNLLRIDRIKQDIEQGHALEQLMFELLQNQLLESSGISPHAQTDIHQKIIRFFATQRSNAADAEELPKKVETLFFNAEQGAHQDTLKALQGVQEVLELQRQEEQKLLQQLYANSKLELNFAVIIPVAVLLCLLLVGMHFLRRRVMKPLDALEGLLSRLIEGEMQPIAEQTAEPLMQPLFNSYNRLIRRLAKLEAEHLSHTQTLEQEIRNATHTLLEQSHTLARAERLAAVGEIAASAAHELRNPLAGIQAALENMFGDCHDADMAERLQLVSAETKRLSSRLNDLLVYSKHQPETAKHVDIARLVGELLTLLKYQVNENINLLYSTPPQIHPLLPETEFRQALLNLLLNSIQELGKQGGTVKLQIEPQQDNLLIEVRDSGPGFPKTLLEHGIRPFVSYREHGTGLGLSMVQRFARSLGGRLILKNDSEGHACAILSLPMQA